VNYYLTTPSAFKAHQVPKGFKVIVASKASHQSLICCRGNYCIWYFDVNTVVFAAARLAHGPFPFSTIPMTVQSASILLLQGSPTKQIGALAAMPIFV
jgi:hypothetical protein